MKIDDKEKYQVNILTSHGRNILNVIVNNGDDVSKSEVDTVKTALGSLHSLLPIHTYRQDEKQYFEYDIHGKVTMEELYINGAPNDKILSNMIMTVCKLVNNCMDYMLSEDKLVLTPEYIYARNNGLELYFMYLPVKDTPDIIYDLRKFTAWAIEGMETELANKINEWAHNNWGTVDELESIIKNWQTGGKKQPEPRVQPLAEPPKRIPRAKPAPKDIADVSPGQKDNDAGTAVVTKFDRGFYIIALLQVLLLMLVIIAADMGVFANSETGKLDAVNLFAGILLAGAVDYLICRRILKKYNLKKTIYLQKKTAGKASAPPLKPSDPKVKKQLEKPAAKKPEAASDQGKRPNVQTPRQGTRAISQEPSYTAQLVSTNYEKHIRLIFTKSSSIIGSHKSKVDFHIDNSTISRNHAKVICQKGKWFIQDLNSLNHTYVNRSRLNSSQIIELKDGDTVTLSNIDFEFNVIT